VYKNKEKIFRKKITCLQAHPKGLFQLVGPGKKFGSVIGRAGRFRGAEGGPRGGLGGSRRSVVVVVVRVVVVHNGGHFAQHDLHGYSPALSRLAVRLWLLRPPRLLTVAASNTSRSCPAVCR